MPDPRCDYDAFICYAGPDNAQAAELHAALTDAGLRVYFDGAVMRAGDDIDRALLAAIKASHSVVALLSRAWGDGHYNRQELRYAGKQNRQGGPPFRLIPVELDPEAESAEVQTASPIIAHGAEGARWTERVVAAVSAALEASAGADRPPEQLSLTPQALERAYEDALIADDPSAPDLQAQLVDQKRRALYGQPLQPDDELSGRYRLVERLGRGGFAQVWKAFDRVTKDFVALKVLHWNLGHEPIALRRFRRGAECMFKLRHPHIVRVRDIACEDRGYHYFPMDLIDGISLDHSLTPKRLEVDEVPGLIRQVGGALSYAHGKGIHHRDVHPGNIMVGADGQVSLIDFDLVDVPGTVGGTRTGALGTAIYAAPEVHRSSPDEPHALDGAALDVYGLAMTAVACWFDGILGPGELRKFDSVIKNLLCTEAQKKALFRGLEEKPGDRFPSIDALCDALQLPAPGMIDRRLPLGRDWRRGEDSPLAALGDTLPPAVGLHVQPRWDGDDLHNALRSMPAHLAGPARDAIWQWVGPQRSTEELAYVWYALERMGRPPDRERFFDRCARPLPADAPEWVEVMGGVFEMGAPRKGDGPVHTVELSPFRLGATPVTAAQYAAFDPSHQPNHRPDEPLPASDALPARNITWWEAYLFSRWADARLPTEAEWEYACRAGSADDFCCGSLDALPGHAWFNGNSEGRCHPVATRAANAFGVHDMHGLVYEWCADWHAEYSAEPQRDPRGPSDGTRRVMRGGAFSSNALTTRARLRETNVPGSRWPTRGVRLAINMTISSGEMSAPPQAVPGPAPAAPTPLNSGDARVKPAPRSASAGASPEAARPRRRSVAPKPRQQVFDTYWYFAVERQRVFYRRLAGQPGPWTHDPILQDFKFCNTFRASDRVSQFLIRHVIYGDGLSQDAEDVVFRTLLFRLFNKIESWPVFMGVKGVGGEPRAKNFVAARYSKALDAEMEQGNRIFGNAYMIAPPGNAFGGDHARKHDGYLALLAHMLRDGFVQKVQRARHFSDVYQLLLSYPLIGKFIAYQLATDLNYGPVIDFDENDFTKAGPGAERGIDKCFESRGGMSSADIIQWMVKHQDAELERVCARLGYDPRVARLWDLRLKAIDCQNLFCETDKYSRVAFPELKSNRKRIKSKFSATPRKIGYFYPPKWGINDRVHTPPVDLPPLGPAPEDD